MARYETVRIGEGESINPRIGSDETLSNKLYDVSADGADIQIDAHGEGWELRNIGFRGQFDTGAAQFGNPSMSGGYDEALNVDGSGTIDRVYLGNPIKFGVDKAGTIISIRDVGANNRIEIKRMHLTEFTNNGLYIAGYAATHGGTGGTMKVSDSYLVDNNVAQIRCAGNLEVENCTIGNTGNTTPLWETASGAHNIVNARGIRADYATFGESVKVRDCDIDTTAETGGAVEIDDIAVPGQIEVFDSEIRGGIDNGVTTHNVGNSPDMTAPAGVPMTPEQAASGQGHGGTASTASDTAKKGGGIALGLLAARYFGGI